jgi:thioredoxin 1
LGRCNILVEVTDQKDFESYTSRRALVVFSAPAWCAPCRALSRQLDVLKNRLDGNLPIVYVDIDKAEVIKNAHSIMSVPKMYLFENGKPTKEVTGRTVLQIETELASD